MKNYEDQNQELQEPDLTGTYTARDYISWKTEELMELIRGKIFKMSPAPLWRHQEVFGELAPYLQTHLCDETLQGISCLRLTSFLFVPDEDWKETKNVRSARSVHYLRPGKNS